MVARSILALASAAAVAQAIQITAPSNSSGWNTHGSQLIQWTVSPLSDQRSSTLAFLFRRPHALHYTNADYIIQSVITDAQNFTIAISKPNSSSRTILSPRSSTLLTTLTSTCPPATLRLATVIGSVSLLLTVAYWLRAMNLASPTVPRKFLS